MGVCSEFWGVLLETPLLFLFIYLFIYFQFSDHMVWASERYEQISSGESNATRTGQRGRDLILYIKKSL